MAELANLLSVLDERGVDRAVLADTHPTPHGQRPHAGQPELAKVTHEAAIGSADRHQMETLMAHGLSPHQAVDLIVGGLLGKPEAEDVVRFRPQALRGPRNS